MIDLQCNAAVCDSPCQNGGDCVAPGMCDCTNARGWMGKRCEQGWLTVYTVDWLYMLPLFVPLTEFEKINPVFECESTGPCMVTFLLQVFVTLHVKMVEGVLRQMFVLVRLAGQEFGAKQVSHAVYP